MEVQRHLVGALGADVLRHMIDVFHYLHRFPEGICIDPLNHILFGADVWLAAVHPVGAVDIPHLDLVVGIEIAGMRNASQICHSFRAFFS